MGTCRGVRPSACCTALSRAGAGPTNSVCTKRLLKAGCAASAPGAASTTYGQNIAYQKELESYVKALKAQAVIERNLPPL